MTYTICNHRKYRGGDVLESSVRVESLDDVFGMMKQSVLDEYVEVVAAIKRGDTGHHFMDDSEFTYQIVVKKKTTTRKAAITFYHPHVPYTPV